MLIGMIHLTQGDLGPARRIGSRVWNLERLRSVDEQAWKRERYQQALDAFRRARELAPDDTRPAVAVAETLDRIEDHTGSVQAWTEVRGLAEESPEAHLGLADALRRVGALARAEAEYETALSLDPHAGDAYEGLAELQAVAGASAVARENRRKAFFYAWIPKELSVDYSDEAYRLVRDLNATSALAEQDDAGLAEGEIEPQEAERVVVDEGTPSLDCRRLAVERLIADSSPTSSVLLAALCMNHVAHGELEESAFAALESRGEACQDLLMTLLAHGRSLCTKRQAVQALARQKIREAVPLLLTLLPQDTNRLWRMGIADALARIGDPRAVGPLIDMLEPPGRCEENSRDRDPGHSPLEALNGIAEDRLSNRWRCALALGCFEDDSARAALRRGTTHQEVRASCLAACYRSTGDLEYLTRLEEPHVELDSLQTRMLVAYLREFDPAAADRLLRNQTRNPTRDP
jgi:HEAT repeat protein